MSFGLEVFDQAGVLKFGITGRFFRLAGSITVPDSATASYPFPGITNDETWIVLPNSNGVAGVYGSIFTGLDISISSGFINTAYHSGNASYGLNIVLDIYRF